MTVLDQNVEEMVTNMKKEDQELKERMKVVKLNVKKEASGVKKKVEVRSESGSNRSKYE